MPDVDIGRMRHRVTLQRKASEGDGPAGDEEAFYESDRSYWAEVVPLSGRELVNAAAIKATTSHRIRMRVNGPIGEGDRLIFPSIPSSDPADIPDEVPEGRRIFNIDSVIRIDEVAAYYEIMATEARG